MPRGLFLVLSYSVSMRDVGEKKKSAAEKCHLQPDAGARAFTNLPVTVTA